MQSKDIIISWKKIITRFKFCLYNEKFQNVYYAWNSLFDLKLCQIIKNWHIYSVTFWMLKMEKKVENFDHKLSSSLCWSIFDKTFTVNLVIFPAIFHWVHISRATWVMDPTHFHHWVEPKTFTVNITHSSAWTARSSLMLSY